MVVNGYLKNIGLGFNMNNEPVAWGMLDKDGGIYDSISPEEHDREEGAYTIPLYTHPAKTLDEQFEKGFKAGKEEGWKAHKFHYPAKTLTDEEILKMAADRFHYSEYKLVIEFARAILRKAQNE
jgi:hypothetical protein